MAPTQSIAQDNTAQHSTAQHSTAQRSAAQHSMAHPLKSGEGGICLRFQSLGPQHIPQGFAGFLEASILECCPDCIVGNACILHLHAETPASVIFPMLSQLDALS